MVYGCQATVGIIRENLPVTLYHLHGAMGILYNGIVILLCPNRGSTQQ